MACHPPIILVDTGVREAGRVGIKGRKGRVGARCESPGGFLSLLQVLQLILNCVHGGRSAHVMAHPRHRLREYIRQNERHARVLVGHKRRTRPSPLTLIAGWETTG